MQIELRDQDHSIFLKKINWQLMLILLLMTACFFTWSENVAITRVIKVVGRMGMLYASWYVYKSIIQYGAADNLKTNNILSMSFYGIYLLLGFVSFMWSTNVGYSALQWFMTSQTLVFCFFLYQKFVFIGSVFS
jgi:exopolysaccharide production protein ExoQ